MYLGFWKNQWNCSVKRFILYQQFIIQLARLSYETYAFDLYIQSFFGSLLYTDVKFIRITEAARASK